MPFINDSGELFGRIEGLAEQLPDLLFHFVYQRLFDTGMCVEIVRGYAGLPGIKQFAPYDALSGFF